MAMNLSELIVPPTAEQMRVRLFALLQGLGFTKREGYSPGNVVLSGTPSGEYTVKIKIIAAGTLGTATFQYSTDDGVTYSATNTVPSGGSLLLGSTGLTATFSAGPSSAGDSFRLGDVFTIEVQRSSFPVTSFQVGSTGRTLVENDAVALAELWDLVSTLAESGLILTASGEWLRLIAKQFYSIDYYQAVATQGYVLFTDSGGSGPYTKAANEVWVQTAGGKRFNNISSFTIPASGSVAVPVQAESPGALWNVGVGQINSIVTSIPGVIVSNPAYFAGDWITRAGNDDEGDESLRTRCLARWPNLSAGATAQQYDSWARDANAAVTRTRIAASSTAEGTVDIVLAGASGGVTGAVVNDVYADLLIRKPLTESINVASAVNLSIDVTATLYVRAGFETSALSKAEENLARLFSENEIGATMYRNNIIEELSTPDGIRNVTLTLPAADTSLAANEVAVSSVTLTVVTV